MAVAVDVAVSCQHLAADVDVLEELVDLREAAIFERSGELDDVAIDGLEVPGVGSKHPLLISPLSIQRVNLRDLIMIKGGPCARD